MAIPFIQPAFSSGELAPELWARTDLAKFHSALSTCRNCFINYKGGASSRAGTALVGFSPEPPDHPPPRVITFQFSVTQSYALEFGEHYMCVATMGGYVTEAPIAITGVTLSPGNVTVHAINSFSADVIVFISGVAGIPQLTGQFRVGSPTGSQFQVLNAASNPIDPSTWGAAYISGGTVALLFTLATPYAASDLPLLKWTQSADVMTLVHPNYPPYDLQRFGPTNWVLTQETFETSIAAPQILTGVATSSGTTGYSYVVTSIDSQTGQQSVRSNEFNVDNAVDMTSTAGSIALTWTGVPRALRYNIFRAPISFGGVVPVGSTYGYIGTSFGTQFTDTNIVTDFTVGPPLFSNPFAPGPILYVTMTAGGSGYTVAIPTPVTGTGSGFVAESVIVGGAVTAVIIFANGHDFVAGVDTLTFVGDGVGAAGTLTIGPLTGTDPGVAAYFQQRRVYANSLNQPDTLWASQPGAFTNFDKSFPTADTDAITATPWAEEVNGVQFMVPMPSGLVVLTGLEAWQIAGSGTFGTTSIQPITPSNIQAQQQAFQGCHDHVPPIKINYDILYLNSLGVVPRDLSYNFFVNIYTGSDISLLSSHLFAPHQLIEWAWAQEPWKLVWSIREDGILLSLTYLKEQEVLAWSRHDTQGTFYSVCTVSEPPVNAPYFIVKRFGSYYLERMDNRIWDDINDAWCVDSALGVSNGPLTNKVYGLWHLIGQQVTGLGDGAIIPPATVAADGSLTLPFEASTITVGLAFTAQAQTVYLDDGQPTIQGRRKDIYAVTARVVASRDVQAGTNQPDGSAQSPPVIAPTWANMQAIPNLGTPYVTAGGQTVYPLFTGDLRVTVPADWFKMGQVAVQQIYPIPLNLTAVVPEYLPGDVPEVGIEERQQQRGGPSGLFGG